MVILLKICEEQQKQMNITDRTNAWGSRLSLALCRVDRETFDRKSLYGFVTDGKMSASGVAARDKLVAVAAAETVTVILSYLTPYCIFETSSQSSAVACRRIRDVVEDEENQKRVAGFILRCSCTRFVS